ncbi:MAG: hypothetical protein LBC79_01115 [Deltaproteobacteria bacterium]|nr:hypothetical protein [Deltaproteobacteria bacterium]
MPIIAVTANAFREAIEQSPAGGMDGRLGKPIELDRTVSLLRGYLR